MHFCFFVQIALLRADAAGGFTDIASPQDSTITHAQGQGLDGTSSREATPQVLCRRHDVRSVTSADTDQLDYKTKVHLQRPFSGLGSTFFGWTLMLFCFFVQIALLRADAAVGFADIFSPQDSTVAHAQGQGLDETSSWEATAQVLCRRHDVRSVTSADTDQLDYKTKVHLQRPFSGLGSTFFGRTLMLFCFFVQIALLRADAAVGFADISSPQDSTIAHAQGQGLDETSSWKATPQVLCRRHDVRSVTSADTDQLDYKTKVHLQRPFSGLGSTFSGRTLVHFCFFVLIALLRADAAVGFADISSPQDSTIAHAQGQGLDETSSWEATPQVLCRRHDVRSVTSADTDQLDYKTKVHLQRPFSGLGSTFSGRTLVHFCFFVQIALLRVDAAVGFADISSPQDSTIAHAQGQGLDGTSSWEATPQVLCRRHDVRTYPVWSSQHGLGPRFLEPQVSELRFSNTTGASLNCAVAGQPPPRVTWLREGVEVEPLQGLLLLLPNGTLRFAAFAASQFRQEAHSATYRCKAANIFGAILSTEVRVRAVVEQYYEVQVYDEFTIAGNTAVLRCHVPSFVRDDVIVMSWEQKVADKTDVIVSDMKVNVPPRITNVKSSVIANEGDSVELPCAGQGYPPPKYLWERLTGVDNGSPHNPIVVGSSRHEPTEGSLLIRKVEPRDAGKYLCLVTNAVGEERATITLNVRSPVEASLAPEVLNAHVGQPASLRCASAGRPPPRVRWLKDAQELLDDGVRIRLLDDGHLMQLAPCGHPGRRHVSVPWSTTLSPRRRHRHSSFLEASHGENHLASYVNISRIRTEEAGLWRCVGVNSAGAAEATARVAVRGPPEVRPFRSNRTAVATEALEMHCALLTYPIKSVHWEKDGRKLPFHHRQKVFANGTLLLLATTVQDAGKYTCVVTNEQGQNASASLHVIVKVPPLIERFAFDENLYEGMRTRVYCNIARGDPPVRITWLRDGQPVKSSPDIEVRVLDPFSVALVIDSLSPSHDGSYTCVASNTAATVNYTAPLRVNVPPHWIKEPVDTSTCGRPQCEHGLRCRWTPNTESHMAQGSRVSYLTMISKKRAFRVISSRSKVERRYRFAFKVSPRAEPGATEYRQIMSGPDYQVFENGTLRVAQARVSDRVPARFNESYRNQTVQRGHSIALECRASGDAPINISWSRNGRRLDTHK
ncbi:hypothetical protein MRX96_025513, partial [Rhipicephalus microplus]